MTDREKIAERLRITHDRSKYGLPPVTTRGDEAVINAVEKMLREVAERAYREGFQEGKIDPHWVPVVSELPHDWTLLP